MSKATWMLFVDTTWPLDEFFSDVYIPFDCEFVVVQPAGDEGAVLTEVYRVRPSSPLQKYHFGTWSAVDGLFCTDKSLYQRRDNLQGLALKTAFLKVSVLAHSVRIDNSAFERVEGFKYVGTTLANRNSIAEEINSSLRSGNACYHSEQNLCLPGWYQKI